MQTCETNSFLHLKLSLSSNLNNKYFIGNKRKAWKLNKQTFSCYMPRNQDFKCVFIEKHNSSTV